MKKPKSDNPTRKEHFIPVFLLKQFANERGEILAFNKGRKNTEPKLTSPNSILFENDLYETKNVDNTYFENNVIEHKFKQTEDKVSDLVNKFSEGIESLISLSKSDKEFLSGFVALQLLRMPFVKNKINETKYNVIPENEREFFNSAIYRMFIYSRDSGFRYLEENGLGLSQETKEELKGQSLIEYTTNFILEECSIYFAVAAEKRSFVLSDNPVLIDAFPDVHYLLPITPHIAICCGWKADDGTVEENVIYINDIGINKINSLTCKNATRWIVCHENCRDMLMNLLAEQEKNE